MPSNPAPTPAKPPASATRPLEPASSPFVVGAALRLAVGELQRVWVPGITRIAVSVPSVVDVAVPSRSEVDVLGRRPGRTTVIFWAGDGERRVWAVEVSPERDSNAP